MTARIRQILKMDFIKSIFILSGGSLLAQFISFVCSMILTRQYPKDSFGYFTYILSIVTMFSTVINGRYDVSIVSAKDKKEELALIKLSFYVMLVLSVFVSIGAYILTCFSENELKGHEELVFFVFPMLLVYGGINILNAYNNRYAQYKLISSAYLLRTGFQNFLSILFGIFTPTAFGLLFSQTIGLCVGVKKQADKLRYEIRDILNIKIHDLKTVLFKYKEQPLFSVPASFINALSYSAISLFIGSFFDMGTLGMYSISVTVLGVPLGVFGTNIAKVHFKESEIELKKLGNYYKTTLKMIGLASILSFCMIIFLLIFAPELFEFLYGASWREAGEYVQILSPMFGFRLMVGAVGYGFIIAKKQKLELIFQVILLIGMGIVSAIAALYSLDIKSFLSILSICYSVIYILELIKIVKCSKGK